MEQAHTKNISFTKQRGPNAYKVSSLAHHAWPFRGNKGKFQQEVETKPMTLAGSLEQVYREDLEMTWQQSQRRYHTKQQFSSRSSPVRGAGVEATEGAVVDVQRLQKLVKSLCESGSFELLLKAAEDAERRAKMHVTGGVTATALYSAEELQCCSPVKSTRNNLQRIMDREAELEAEIYGLDRQLERKGHLSRTSKEKRVKEGEQEREQEGEQEGKEIAASSMGSPAPLQPQIPHVLHDLPLIFGRARTTLRLRSGSTLAPISSKKMLDVPDSFRVLWPKPKVHVPHYASASPALLSEFLSACVEQIN